MTTLIPVLSNSLFNSHPLIPYCKVPATDSMVVLTMQINNTNYTEVTYRTGREQKTNQRKFIV
jgi:hypothetical protein